MAAVQGGSKRRDGADLDGSDHCKRCSSMHRSPSSRARLPAKCLWLTVDVHAHVSHG